MSGAMSVLIIAVLGALGSLVRFGLLSVFARSAWRSDYPTVTANILGSLGAGVAIAADWGVWSWLIAAGLFGAVTTLSTLAVDVAERLRVAPREGWTLLAWHVVGGFAGFLVGYLIGGLWL